MYLKHFNLERNPFDQLPDPDFLYLTEQHEEALARMQFALAVNDSFMIVTGEVGSGKTTLIRKLLLDMADSCMPVFITHTRLDDIELLRMILVGLGVKPFKMGKSRMLTELHRLVNVMCEEGRRIIIVVDEAQNFGENVLEELRLLTCMDTAKAKSINIVLTGQPQLSTTLRSPDLDQLRQRCRLRFHLNALSDKETVGYVKHRLKIAKGEPDAIFDRDALAAVHGYTRGIPRLINTICDTSMIMAFVEKRPQVTIESIDEAAQELDWSDASSLSGTPVDDELKASDTARLKIMQGSAVRGEYLLNFPSYVIGRSDDCSIAIRSRFLSRHHALLARDSRGWIISDLNSTNGIVVNGRDVHICRLDDGDTVGIGDYVMQFTLNASSNWISTPANSKTDLLNDLPDLA